MSSYNAKIHKDGPDKLVMESRGSLDIKTGATVTVNGSQLATLADVPTGGSADAAANAAAINLIHARLKSLTLIASS